MQVCFEFLFRDLPQKGNVVVANQYKAKAPRKGAMSVISFMFLSVSVTSSLPCTGKKYHREGLHA